MSNKPLAPLMALLLLGCGADTSSGQLVATGPCDGSEVGQPCSDAAPCHAGLVCVSGACVPDLGTCTSDDGCASDSTCLMQGGTGRCVPFGLSGTGMNAPTCTTPTFPASGFETPVLKCQWPAAGASPLAYSAVADAPLVVDLDGDKQPELVFQAGYGTPAHLVALSGSDCSVKFDRAAPLLSCTHLAAGDLDGDGLPELVGQGPTGLVVFDHNGVQLAADSTKSLPDCGADYPPLIVNLDGMGPPEIVSDQEAWRYVATPTPSLKRLWTMSPAATRPNYFGSVTVAADLDGDGKPEVIAGGRVVDGRTGLAKDKSALKDLVGYSGVADFNKDGQPDVVVVNSNTGPARVTIIDYTNNVALMPTVTLPSSGGGPPIIADFDGDGVPDVGVATGTAYNVLSIECLKTPKPAKCSAPGLLWSSVTQDTSQFTGASVFDFNGDGKPEVVYRDECWLRGYNGADGTKLFALPITSGTAQELPVVADTDHDGHADLVVTSDDLLTENNCNNNVSRMELGQAHSGPSFGVRIYRDAKNRWVPSRPIWNQHSYHITNVTDTATIPSSETANWKSFNNFRQNSQSIEFSPTIPVADATVRDAGACSSEAKAQVCNRGAAVLGQGLPVSFYDREPRDPMAMRLCTAQTAMPLAVGQCTDVSCQPAGALPPTVFASANDDGRGGRPYNECHSGNNTAPVCSPPVSRCTTDADCSSEQLCDTLCGQCWSRSEAYRYKLAGGGFGCSATPGAGAGGALWIGALSGLALFIRRRPLLRR